MDDEAAPGITQADQDLLNVISRPSGPYPYKEEPKGNPPSFPDTSLDNQGSCKDKEPASPLTYPVTNHATKTLSSSSIQEAGIGLSDKRSERRPPSPLGLFGGFKPPIGELHKAQVLKAKQLDLLLAPTNPSAEALVEAALERVLAHEAKTTKRKRKRRADVARQLRDAIAAIIGGVLTAWASTPHLPVYRSLRTNGLSGEEVGARTFRAVVPVMVALRLVQQRSGGHAKDRNVGQASRLWPGPALLRLAAEYGVDQDTAKSDFKRRGYGRNGRRAPKVRDPLRLKAIPAHPNTRNTARLDIGRHDEIAAFLRSQVHDLNTFAATIEVEGCAPPRWFRLFYGDFRLYGRLHALGGGNYQGMSGKDRLSKLRIGGEPVVEIDFQSSLLSFIHGALGLSLPEGDLYALPGIPRAVAKLCVNATLGKGSPLRVWPKDAMERLPILSNYHAPEVMAALIGRYPFLRDPSFIAAPFSRLGDPRQVLIHMLMGIESEVIVEVMLALREKATLTLPMHDGLIVPASAEAIACKLLLEAGERIAGLTLRLDVDRADSGDGLLGL